MPDRFPRVTTLFTGISQLATPPASRPHRGAAMADIHVITDAALAVDGDRIRWVGPRSAWHESVQNEVNLAGQAVIPAFVDPHTHLVWAGDRLDDFVARVEGVPYETILARGGGIRSSVRATAAASVEELVDLALPRVTRMEQNGSATIEVKSGYGFEIDAELRSLEAIQALAHQARADIHATLLIHIPPMDPEDRATYLADIVHVLIPEVARRRLATAVDVFVEREAWSPGEAATIWHAASRAGLGVKAHVDQFHAVGGLETAIAHHALSVDHLEASGPDQIAALAASDTVGVILPGVTLHLGIAAAPGRRLIDAGAAVAVGTDCNPGSSPLFSMQQALAYAVRLNGLTPAEALIAGTVNAAAALGLTDRGALIPGMRADFLVLGEADWRTALWTLGDSPITRRYLAGKEANG